MAQTKQPLRRLLNTEDEAGQTLVEYGLLIAMLSILVIIALLAYRLTLARCMVRQYPWLYESAGPFAWRPRR